MNDPKIEPAELKRRKDEKALRYSMVMKRLRPAGFVQDGNMARLMHHANICVDMDDPDIHQDPSPSRIVSLIWRDAYADGARAAKAEIRKALGIYQ